MAFLRTLYELADMIKLPHSVLALPFAFMGAMLAARGLPEGRIAFWILIAMVGARSAAMAFNRLADAPFDALNPRTADRALPGGRVSRSATVMFILVSSLIFISAAAQLNRVCLMLSPLALGVILGYSLSKRSSALCHWILGLSLALAPVGGWLAVREDLGLPVLALAASVLFWVAGFDILYALQDEEFDRAAGLFSLPSRRGTRQARRAAALCHFFSVLGFVITGALADLGGVYMAAVMFSAIILASEHIMMARRGTVSLPPAFFTLNSLVSVGLGLATLVSLTF